MVGGFLLFLLLCSIVQYDGTAFMKQKPSGMIESDALEGSTPFSAFSCGLGIGGPWKEYQKEEKLGLVIVETSPMTWHGICRCFDDSHGGV